MLESIWKQSLDYLESVLPLKQFDTWLRPLQAEVTADGLCLLAPNEYVRDWVDQHYREQIRDTLERVGGGHPYSVTVAVGSASSSEPAALIQQVDDPASRRLVVGLQARFQFSTFIEGKSNQLALAASLQVAENPGIAYNPLLIYGAVGLGKTHLVHAIGNEIVKRPGARVAYLPAMDFVRNMVSSLRHNQMEQFNQYYRSFDALLVDDIQFFAGKAKSQEEFFHAFDALLQGDHQIVLTCDRYPREVDALPERLTSRFESGISYAIEPPDLETRAAILTSKAALVDVDLPENVALFLADRLKSNVRDLEGALRRVIMGSRLQGRAITIGYCRDVLGDLFSIQDRLVTIENIQKTVAEYFRIRVSDLNSKRRHRSIVRPRQVAMALARELTNRSFPEIGAAFGDRDHTTVLHACRKVEELQKSDSSVDTDYRNLLRRLRT
ncbi:MAG: chromosomal replication initiator protein DnaA [Immundisolibacterales bacterium]|nr:chromosomal replication initiator protein DnaA [Immundisolibacterales bacterium]